MYLIYLVLLLIIYFLAFADSQGGRGGGGGIGGFRGGHPLCVTGSCKENEMSTGRFLWIFGPALLTICCICMKLCCMLHEIKPIPKHSTFINVPNSDIELDDINPFQSGLWSSRYFQYEQWHGPYQFLLTFDHQTMNVTGSGSDDADSFIISGIYSIKTRRIGLTKRYILGTGNPSANFGHLVTIQLEWDAQNRLLKGTYYVAVTIYEENKFELKFDRPQSEV